MTELLTATALFALLLASSAVGLVIQPHLRDRHLSRDSIDAVRLIITMLVTFAALVLGLLTSSVKDTFDRDAQQLRSFGVELIQLDHRLREIGPAAEPARQLLGRYTAAAIASTWSRQEAPLGDYPHVDTENRPNDIGSDVLLAMLHRADTMIRTLPADSEAARSLRDGASAQMSSVLTQRWKLVELAHPSMSWPFMAVLLAWLAVVFLTFGLSSPRNGLVYAMIVLSGFSIASVVYVILDLDTPIGGFVEISSQPMRDALRQMREPIVVSPDFPAITDGSSNGSAP
jgi:hypothetical protein